MKFGSNPKINKLAIWKGKDKENANDDDSSSHGSLVSTPTMLVVLQEDLPPSGEEKLVTKVVVRTGRHVDNITFYYSDLSSIRHGRPGGASQPPFLINHEGGEYIVRIVGRQGDLLDGVQFITNFGTRSAWFGGRGGESFSLYAQSPGLPLINIVSEDSSGFCPRIAGAIASPTSPASSRPPLLRLLTRRSVLRLLWSGKPSLLRNMLAGRPSLLRLSLRGSPSLFRIVTRGRESLLRVFLDGEQFAHQPHSLLRMGASRYPGFARSAFDLFTRRRAGAAESVAQLMFAGRPSLFRQLFADNPNSPDGRSIAHWMFRRDESHGRPPVLRLLLEGEAEGRPSLLRLLLLQEGEDAAAEYVSLSGAVSAERRPSLLRVMCSGEHAVLRQIMAVGGGALTRRLLEEQGPEAASLARTFFTDPLNAQPSVARYLFHGEQHRQDSPMRLLMRGEGPFSPRPSLMDLLCQPYSDRPSLLELLSAGRPSIIDLLLRGEEQGEGSLARVFLGSAVVVEDGAVRVKGALRTDLKGQPWTLATVALAGEEPGGPGLSLMRLFLFGEHRGDESLLRLMLRNEQEGTPSFLRALVTGMHAALVAARTGTTNVSRWQDNVRKIVEAVKGGTQDGSSWEEVLGNALGAVTSSAQWQQQFLQVMSILSSMTNKDSKFKAEWERAWNTIGEEVGRAGERARDDSMWTKLGDQGRDIAFAMAKQQFAKVVTQVASLIAKIDRINRSKRKERKAKGK